MLIVTQKQYLLDNYLNLQFDSDGKVELVREYLEKECGFMHSNWKTEEFLHLKWLCIIDSKFVEGNSKPKVGLTMCNIDHLICIEIPLDIQNGKPIKLKG